MHGEAAASLSTIFACELLELLKINNSKCQLYGHFAQRLLVASAALSVVGSTPKESSKVSTLHTIPVVDLTLAENDIVLLKHTHNTLSTPILSPSLRAGKKIDLQKDSIAHDDILNKSSRDLVSSRKRINYRITWPTLAEYTDLSPRIVTPVSCSILSHIFL